MHHQMSAARTILAARVSPLEFWTVDAIPVRDLHKFPTKAAPFVTYRALLHKIEIALGTIAEEAPGSAPANDLD